MEKDINIKIGVQRLQVDSALSKFTNNLSTFSFALNWVDFARLCYNLAIH